MNLQENIMKYAVAAGVEQQRGSLNFIFSPDNLQEFSNTIINQCIDIIKNQESKLDMIKMINEQFPNYKLNDHVYGLAERAGIVITGDGDIHANLEYFTKFTKSIIEECLSIIEECEGDIDYAIFKTKQQML